jgi:putative ABC transport system ATP-binding protein
MPPLIQLRDVVFSVTHPEPQEILRVPEFSLEAGDHCVIHGPSGSGKTTLFHLLAGLLSPTRGTLEVAGTRLEALGEAERDVFRRTQVGFIFQSFNLLQGLTALENVLVALTISGANATRDDAHKLMIDVGLEHRLYHYPAQLSIGEQQRVAVARSLIHHPPLLLADEPTGSLDPVRSCGIIDLLFSLATQRGTTLFVISHDPAVVERFPRRVSILDLNAAFSTTTTKETAA